MLVFCCPLPPVIVVITVPVLQSVPMTNLSTIVSSLQAERKQLAAQLEQLDSALAVLTRGRGKHAGVPKTRTISAAGRARIAAAQRARWAKVKGQKVVSIARKGRTMSAAARKRIVAAQKARWAKWRKEHR